MEVSHRERERCSFTYQKFTDIAKRIGIHQLLDHVAKYDTNTSVLRIVCPQVDDSGHRIRKDLSGNSVFFWRFTACSRLHPAGKSTGRWKQYSGRNFIVRGNGKMRQAPFTGFYPEVRGIRAGDQPEINVSLRNLTGKVLTAAGCQLKNTGFRGTLIKSFSIFWVTERQTRKVF